MAALYFHALRPEDKVAVKPHAGPVLHAIHYLMGNQTLDQLQRFRGLGGESAGARSEEHTSELQSLMRISYAVFCLKKKKPPPPHARNGDPTRTHADTAPQPRAAAPRPQCRQSIHPQPH